MISVYLTAVSASVYIVSLCFCLLDHLSPQLSHPQSHYWVFHVLRSARPTASASPPVICSSSGFISTVKCIHTILHFTVLTFTPVCVLLLGPPCSMNWDQIIQCYGRTPCQVTFNDINTTVITNYQCWFTHQEQQ